MLYTEEDKSDVERKELGIVGLSWAYLKLATTCFSLWAIGYFQFSPSWVALGSFGYLVLKRAHKKRKRMTSSLKSLGKNEKQAILQNFSVRDLPSWVYFPDVERAEWLNKVIKRMWPFISDYAKNIILESIEPAISANVPSALQPFKFTTIDLGDTPPRFGGVKVYMEDSIKRDEVIIDLDVMLYSDARIKVQLGKIGAGVKEFELRGTLRVVMKPLVPKVPFTGAVTVCFLDSPYINFLLTDMGNLLALPGIQNTLHTVIRDVVASMVVLPNRLPIQLLDDVDLQQLRSPLPQGVLRINVVSGRNLVAGDKSITGRGTSDPYCTIRVGAHKFVTSVIYKTLQPTWNEFFEAVVDVWRGQSLEIEVFDKDQGNKDDFLGNTTVPIETVHNRGNVDLWASLEGVKKGSVHLKLYWYSLSYKAEDFVIATSQAQKFRETSKRAISSGLLFLVVEQASNLMRVKQLQEPSAYCHIQLGRQRAITETKPKTQNPLWNHPHHFLVGDPEVDVLQIVVRDSRTESNLGTCRVPMKLLLTEKRMCVSRPFPLQESGPDGATIHLNLHLLALIPGEEDLHGKQDEDVLPANLHLSRLNSISGGVDTSEPPATDEAIGDSADSEMTVRQRQLSPQNPSSPSATKESQPEMNGMNSLDVTSGLDGEEETVLPSATSPESVSPRASVSAFGQLELQIKYNSLSSYLEVTILRAEKLMGVDKDGLADPYIKLCLKRSDNSDKGEKRKTKVYKDNLNPVFDESFEFSIEEDELASHVLQLDVKNHVGRFTRSGRTYGMGFVDIQLGDYNLQGGIHAWFTLQAPNTSKSDRLSLVSEPSLTK